MEIFILVIFTGVIATALDWTYDASEYSFGEMATLSFDVDVSTTDDSRTVDGLRLWQLGMFVSTAPDGSGRREAVRTQILDGYNQARPLSPPSPIDFEFSGVRLDMNPLGCTDFRYLCLEFGKQAGSDPEFSFATATGGDTLVSCKEVQCQGE